MSKKNKARVPKSDSSPVVHQKGIMKDPFEIRELPWTEKQKRFIELAGSKEAQVILVKGPAGTSKSALAVFCCLQALNNKKISDIILSRSIVESSDNKMGYLPGTADDKLYPYLVPFFDKLEMFINKQDLQRIQAEERISTVPVSFLRGLDWNRKAITLDEAQNTTRKELLTFMTRIGKFCKTFIIGDPTQADIKNSGFEEVFNLFNTEEAKSQGIFCFEFDENDVMRSQLCRYITKSFQTLPSTVHNSNGHNGNNGHANNSKPVRAEKRKDLVEWQPNRIEVDI
jgi:phosphate starvation-inducible protein PhoH and related proteins